MSLFTSLGRRAERVKQKFTSEADYICRSCETAVEDDSVCPNCGSEDIHEVESKSQK